MMVLRFKSPMEHEDLLKKVKKMREFTEDLEECLKDVIEEREVDYRDGRHHEDYYEDEPQYRGRYGYRSGGRSRM